MCKQQSHNSSTTLFFFFGSYFYWYNVCVDSMKVQEQFNNSEHNSSNHNHREQLSSVSLIHNKVMRKISHHLVFVTSISYRPLIPLMHIKKMQGLQIREVLMNKFPPTNGNGRATGCASRGWYPITCVFEVVSTYKAELAQPGFTFPNLKF